MYKHSLSICLCFLLFAKAGAQLCTVFGATPVTPIFVCSAESQHVNTPQYCGQTMVPTPCTDGGLYQNKNPTYFRFACYNNGTAGFTIVPDELTADYNWQLFDVTNTNPVDVLTNPNLFVACNWSSNPGNTGASINGNNLIECSGPQPTFSSMPDLQSGHAYLLMVSNESSSAAGFTITFSGGSAIITDQNIPHLLFTDLSCDRQTVTVRLNKQVRCNSVAPNGSDFSINGPVTITSASPSDCSSPFGTPAVILQLNQPLPLGAYTLTMNNGTDGNTLMDDCTRSVPAGEQIPLISAPPQPTPMDSVYNVRCKPSFIELVFKKPIVCSSIAADGSDFFITGPQTVTVTPVLPSCGIGPTTNIIRLDLSSNISVGTYQVVLRTGTDGNTIINECGVETPVNSMVSFVVSESVSAVFTNSSNTSCTQSQVSFLHNGANNVISWNWTFSNGVTSALPNPVVNFNKGNYTVRLIVSNGTCADTSNQVIKISDGFKADFDFPAIVCPGDLLTLTDKSTGNIDSWSWNFGNGQTSNVQNPPAFFYTDTGSDMLFAVKLVVSNSLIGCNDTSTHVIRKLKNCLIAVPSAFTPNNDGKNDFLYPLNAVKADQLEFKVYNRYGQLVFFTKDWTRKWDGRINGNLQDTGVFAWILTYTDRDTKEKIIKKGTSLLIR